MITPHRIGTRTRPAVSFFISSEVRPIVCSHDSSISSIRITSNRPKIIKLHGDFLFDNIKNTVRELETLEQNTQDKFKQYASEFGFIVIGYSGNDRSIMDTFNTLLRFDQYFPHGIYWCVRKGATLSKNVELLSRFPKFKVVEIEGFDEFFAELNNELSLPLQQEMTNPYASLAMKLNRLIEKLNLPEETEPHPIIENDIRRLGRQIKKISNNSNGVEIIDIAGTNENLPIPYGLLSNLSFRDGEYDKAFKFRLKELETDPSPKAFSEAFKLMYLANRQNECKDDLVKRYFAKAELVAKQPMSSFDASLVFISNKDFETADKILEFGKNLAESYGGEFNQLFYFLNKLQVIKHKGETFTENQIKDLQNLAKTGDINTRIGSLSLLENVEEVEALLKKIHEKDGIYYMLSWPILDFIRDKVQDLELKNLLTTTPIRKQGIRAS
jgi:tetratricopeptide (TPR) repeat protein